MENIAKNIEFNLCVEDKAGKTNKQTTKNKLASGWNCNTQCLKSSVLKQNASAEKGALESHSTGHLLTSLTHSTGPVWFCSAGIASKEKDLLL